MAHREEIAAMLEAAQVLDGLQVTIRRDFAVTTGVNALVGETITSIDDGSGALVEARSRDFIIFTEDYKFNGVKATPAPDDYIIDAASGDPLIYQVLPFFGDEQRRWSDPYGVAWRIHTKLTDAIRILVLLDNDEVPTFDSSYATFDNDD